MTGSNIGESKAIAKLNEALESKKRQLSLTPRTAKLWVSNYYYINVVKQIICAKYIK